MKRYEMTSVFQKEYANQLNKSYARNRILCIVKAVAIEKFGNGPYSDYKPTLEIPFSEMVDILNKVSEIDKNKPDL